MVRNPFITRKLPTGIESGTRITADQKDSVKRINPDTTSNLKVTSTGVVETESRSESNSDEKFAMLIPLAGTMKKALAEIGITPATKIRTLVEQFYNEIVRKNQTNNFTGTYVLPEIHVNNYSSNHADEAVDAIITGVVAYVNALLEKKNSGEQLSKTEDIIATGAQKAQGEAENQVKKSMAAQVGEAILYKGGWIWILGGVVGLIILASVIRKK